MTAPWWTMCCASDPAPSRVWSRRTSAWSGTSCCAWCDHRRTPRTSRRSASCGCSASSTSSASTARHLERKALPIERGAAFEDGEAFDPLDHIADATDIAADLAEADLQAHAQRLIEALPPLQRTVLSLYHGEELGIAEIARITERPEGTIKNLLFRIRLRLREALKDAIGEPA